MRPDFKIDVDAVLERKGIRLPACVKRLIGRILHLDYLNGYFVQGDEGVDFCKGALEYLGVSLEVEGLENLPREGRFTFASNHPLGGIDGIALGAVVGSRYDGRIKYLVNDFLMAVKGLAPICVPISKTGGQSRNLPELIDGAFRSDSQILIFPAGLCSRRIDGRIQDLPWSKTFIIKSIETGRDIIPVHFEARNSDRFYRIARLCSLLKLKFNFAMVLLPDEMCRQRGGTFKVVFGKPIPVSTFDKTRSAKQWASYVREEVYKL